MNTQTIDTAVAEAKRFLQRVEELKLAEEATLQAGRNIYYSTHSKQKGALRRASMDLSRALADLRRPG